MIESPSISFRTAQFIDIDPLIELVTEFYEFEQISLNAEVIKAFTALLSNEQYGTIWLICDRDRPIGYAALTFFFSMEYYGLCGLLDELYIKADYRGQGIGKQILDFVTTYLQNQGSRSLTLVVDDWNHAAETFYLKNGFTRTNRHVMLKQLST
ncbi:MAG: GNAT family N-acetyltransferase [Pseudanabaenaceae cyanobacterium bins.39]|nr:GNAT family N-acetyltransferase [Pseudanabaenaceae cyanobacterium bins.39]